MNDLTLTRTIFSPNNPWSLARWREFMATATTALTMAWFTIYAVETWEPIGFTGLTDIAHHNRSAEFNINIGPTAARGQGFETEATRLMLDYGFFALGLHNIGLRVMTINPAAIRAYEKAGFRVYGRRTRCQSFGGRLV